MQNTHISALHQTMISCTMIKLVHVECVCVQCIPSTLSPEDFSLQLLGCLNTCSAPSKMKILAALQALHSQGLLENTDKLYQGLSDLVYKFVRPHMVRYVQDHNCHCAF